MNPDPGAEATCLLCPYLSLNDHCGTPPGFPDAWNAPTADEWRMLRSAGLAIGERPAPEVPSHKAASASWGERESLKAGSRRSPECLRPAGISQESWTGMFASGERDAPYQLMEV